MGKSIAILGKGHTITFVTLGVVAQIESMDISDMGMVGDVEISNFDSPEPGPGEYGGREFIPGGLQDAGTVTLTLVFNPDVTLPPRAVMDTIVVQQPARKGYSVGGRMTGEGYIRTTSRRAPSAGDKVTQDVVIKKTGVWSEIPAVKV